MLMERSAVGYSSGPGETTGNGAHVVTALVCIIQGPIHSADSCRVRGTGSGFSGTPVTLY